MRNLFPICCPIRFNAFNFAAVPNSNKYGSAFTVQEAGHVLQHSMFELLVVLLGGQVIPESGFELSRVVFPFQNLLSPRTPSVFQESEHHLCVLTIAASLRCVGFVINVTDDRGQQKVGCHHPVGVFLCRAASGYQQKRKENSLVTLEQVIHRCPFFRAKPHEDLVHAIQKGLYAMDKIIFMGFVCSSERYREFAQD